MTKANYVEIAQLLGWDSWAAIILCNSISRRALVEEYSATYEGESIPQGTLVNIKMSYQFRQATAKLTGHEDEGWVNDLLTEVNLHRLVK